MNTGRLAFEAVHYRYPSGVEALRGVTFSIGAGERVALVGANGAGKSTLLLHANGLLTPTAGRVEAGGEEVTPKRSAEVRRTVGLVFQNADDQLFMPTVREDVAFGPQTMGLQKEEIECRVQEALAAVGAAELADAAPFHLSCGQKKRVAIASVLAMRPSVLVMDEPTAGLDPKARRRLIELLENLPHTLLVATHDLDLVTRICPRTVILDRGHVAADGPTAPLFADLPLLESCGLR